MRVVGTTVVVVLTVLATLALLPLILPLLLLMGPTVIIWVIVTLGAVIVMTIKNFAVDLPRQQRRDEDLRRRYEFSRKREAELERAKRGPLG